MCGCGFETSLAVRADDDIYLHIYILCVDGMVSARSDIVDGEYFTNVVSLATHHVMAAMELSDWQCRGGEFLYIYLGKRHKVKSEDLGEVMGWRSLMLENDDRMS